MRCIVTGGLGFIGSNLTDRLIELGHEVTVIDNLYSGRKEYMNPGAIWVNVDIRHDLNTLHLEGDVIFHCGAQARIQPSFDKPVETSIINIFGTLRVLELARKLKAKVIYAGSSSYYGDPHKNPYALTKWIGEEECIMYNQVYGVPVAIARFFNVYGPRQPMDGSNATVIGIFERQRAANQTLTVTGTGEQRRDFTHVKDIVEGLIAMSKEPWNGEIFNLGSGVNYSINEVADMFYPEVVEHIPARPGEAWETLADIAFTKEKLGWEPKWSLKDYVDEFMAKIDPEEPEAETFWEWVRRIFSAR